MSAISKRVIQRLSDREFRNAYRRARVRTLLAYQIRTIRKQRGWLQGFFARMLSKPQSVVSRWENPEYGRYTVETLHEIADAFDCGLLIKFEPYQDFMIKTSDLSPNMLVAEAFDANHLMLLGGSQQQSVTLSKKNDSVFLVHTNTSEGHVEYHTRHVEYHTLIGLIQPQYTWEPVAHG